MSSEVRDESGGEAAYRVAAQVQWDQEQVSTRRHEGLQQWMGEGKQQSAGLSSQDTNRFSSAAKRKSLISSRVTMAALPQLVCRNFAQNVRRAINTWEKGKDMGNTRQHLQQSLYECIGLSYHWLFLSF